MVANETTPATASAALSRQVLAAVAMGTFRPRCHGYECLIIITVSAPVASAVSDLECGTGMRDMRYSVAQHELYGSITLVTHE